MMRRYEAGAVESIPSGLCACRLDGKAVHIAAISPRSILLRSSAPLGNPKNLTLYFYHTETGAYNSYSIHPMNGEVQHESGAVLTRFCFDDPACAAAVRRMLNDYARYLEIKSQAGAAAYAQYAVNYPADRDEIFFPDLASQRRVWFESMHLLPDPGEKTELALELNCEELWLAYLKLPLEEFMHFYAECRNLPPNLLPRRLPNRIYIGNPFCSHVFPREEILEALAAKAERENVALTLVFAQLRWGDEAAADRIAAFAYACNAELVVNDWGMLERIQHMQNRPRLLLGTQLNRRRKDPRMVYKTGISQRKNLLKENALNDPLWRKFLQEMGIERYEYESCALPMQPSAPCSLHLPFYQTNTSLWCSLQAICTHGDRGAQSDSGACPHWCNENVLLYPGHLNMLGRWNSLLALDEAPMAHAQHFDRWVLNF